jgi:acetolactate synthase-1/2/3 large subunit
VIRNIQDAHYGGRRYFVDLNTPDFAKLAQSIGLAHRRVQDLSELGGTLRDALAERGPVLMEIDMVAVGPFARAFSGPPVRKVHA